MATIKCPDCDMVFRYTHTMTDWSRMHRHITEHKSNKHRKMLDLLLLTVRFRPR